LLAGQRSKLEEVISYDHQALLAAYVARQPRPANPPPPEPVIAPPELRDDDPTYRYVRRRLHTHEIIPDSEPSAVSKLRK
jgi:hypothetical protein